MAKIGCLWAGKIFGTNTGNIALDLDSKEDGFTGILRLADDANGVVVYNVTGTFDGSTVALTGTATQTQLGVATGDITATGNLTPEGHLRGKWSSTIGTGGTFHLFPHDQPQITLSSADAPPEQIYTVTRTLGAIRMYVDDVGELIEFLEKDFTRSRIVVTYHERGSEISKYASDFKLDKNRLTDIRYLKLTISEPEAHGINRFASVELDANGANVVRTQGIQESWVIGKAEALVAQLRTREKFFATSVRKFGFNINAVFIAGALAAIPDLKFWQRIAFIILIAFLASGIAYLHRRFIPNATISLENGQPRLRTY